MGSEYQPLSSAEPCTTFFIETSECFICRDVELQASGPLRNFCDCKNSLSHHACLSTWIQKGCGSKDRLRCVICKAKYQLQRRSPWLSLALQWRTWLVLITVLVLLCLVPYAVHCMMTVFTDPPPPTTFKVAAATFGLLMEFLLIKCAWSYIGVQYQQAERSSFTVRHRGSEEGASGRSCWYRCGSLSAEAGRAPAADSPIGERKESEFKSACLTL
ncbi:uncharacterized protein LOC114854608 [Betta splendens]|uniref:Uncharacterized protein LOC114854608 n=1 Tax=Betta splendens TaxID=158456 RepID=A0A6P7MDL1_BETSP|nr:uncharacterized protein LOC114854608 [Betta splendens]